MIDGHGRAPTSRVRAGHASSRTARVCFPRGDATMLEDRDLKLDLLALGLLALTVRGEPVSFPRLEADGRLLLARAELAAPEGASEKLDVSIHRHVAEVNPDTEFHAALGGQIGIPPE